MLSFYSSGVVAANLKLKLFNALLHADDILLKSGLVVLELGELLLKSSALCLLVCVVSLDLLLDTVELIGQSLAGVALLHGENALESLLLTAQNLNLLLVSVEVLLQLSHSVIQVVQLALEMSGVVRATCMAS